MSPFGSLIPRQPAVYFRNQSSLPSRVARNANSSPVRAIFLATPHSTLVYPERSRRATSHCRTLRFPRFHQLTNPSLPTIDLQPSRYQELTNPSFRNPFVFSSIQNPRGCGGADFQFSPRCLCASVENPMFSAVCRLFVLSLRSFLHSFPLFSTTCSLFCKTPGVGGPPKAREPAERSTLLSIGGRGDPALQLPGQTTRGHAGACPLHNSNQLRVSYAPAPFEKLPTASASVLYTSKTVRSLVICRTS